MKILLFVAAGGAIGAVCRYLVGVGAARWFGVAYPWGTLTVNILGSLILGILVEAFAIHWSPSQEVRAFFAVGVLGAFTTFSSFSMETILLFERGEIAASLGYVVMTVILSIGAFAVGMFTFRQVCL